MVTGTVRAEANLKAEGDIESTPLLEDQYLLNLSRSMEGGFRVAILEETGLTTLPM